MKRVVSQFPYEEEARRWPSGTAVLPSAMQPSSSHAAAGSSTNHPEASSSAPLPSLRSEPAVVAERLRDELQRLVRVEGIRVVSFALNELAYAPEIAHSMLKRQQAVALLEARWYIVDGAGGIANQAVEKYASTMKEDRKQELLANLLLVLVGEKDITPTLSLTAADV